MSQPAPQPQVDAVFQQVYEVLMNLRDRGYVPDFVVDVGASSGCWSYHCQLVYPQSRYILIEPLRDEYKLRPYDLIDQFPQFEVIAAAVSDRDGELTLKVASDLVSSSTVAVGGPLVKEIAVPCKTLATIAEEKKLRGRGLIKVDIQFAEDLAFMGAGTFLDQVDVVISEVSLYRFGPSAKTYYEIISLLHERGFQYFDDAGEYRRGLLMCKDVVFVRRDMADRLLREASGQA